jgi:hypothetical protein
MKKGFGQKVESIPTLEKTYRAWITLKALANSSPGLRLGNPGKTNPISRRRNSERVALTFVHPKAAQCLSGLRTIPASIFEPRVSKQTLG